VTTGLADGELETAAEMAAAVAAGHVRASELLDRARARAEAWQPSINAFSQLSGGGGEDDTVLAIDSAPSATDVGPWAGVPIAIKDLFDIDGWETSGCCEAYRGTIAVRDAPMVERAKRAGLLIVGKTNQHELAAGGTNLVSACGPTGNPWDPSRMTGGSSGGSAAAVAAGIVPWAFGSDTGGSIRIPAAMCGTFGLKPTTGNLSTEGMLPLGPSLDCPGPIASTAEDLLRLTEVMTGEAFGEGEQGPEPPYRVGLPDGFFADVHADTAAVVRGAAGAFEGLGVRVEPLDGHGVEDARRVWMDVCTPEFAAAHPLLKDPARRALVAPSVVAWLERGERLSGEERERARLRRAEIGRWFRERLEGLDALLIPTTAYAAPPPGATEVPLATSGPVNLANVGPGWITCSVNLAGLPALSFPSGRSADGMPIGVSLVGHEDQELRLLRIASLWERGTGYRPQRPQRPAPGE
jgi:aspartyl-tRNA(Asn)/glutamyl-tRNA(Gln) amidotransferase subunit A